VFLLRSDILNSKRIRVSQRAMREWRTSDELNAHIEAFTRTVPTAALVPLLEQAWVPAAEVRSPAEAVRDPRVQARGETVPLDHPQFGPRG
jgi:crotonobetainyl-CoA:carnitine CoA-transferase CaiB-like acyl-CoA transferase